MVKSKVFDFLTLILLLFLWAEKADINTKRDAMLLLEDGTTFTGRLDVIMRLLFVGFIFAFSNSK